MSNENTNTNRNKRKSQVFIAAQSLNDELKNLKSLKRMSIGSMDDLDTRDMFQGQYTGMYANINQQSNTKSIDEETENEFLIEQMDEELRQSKRLTIDSSQYLDIYDDYDDDNESSEGEDLQNYTYANDSVTNQTLTSMDASYNATSAEYIGSEVEQGSTILDDEGKVENNVSDEDKEFTSSLLWVPANKHPSIKPERYLKYVQNKLENLSVEGKESPSQTIHVGKVARSRSSNVEDASIRRRKSFQENEMAGMRFAAKSKSLTRRPSRLRRSFISDDDNDTSDLSLSSNESKENVSTRGNMKNRFSLKEITEELTKMSNNAGFSGNDAVSLARSLSMSINGQRSHYEDDLEFENDNFFYGDATSSKDENDEDELTSPKDYIVKSTSLDLFLQESENLKKKKKNGHYQPSYELELSKDSDDSDDSDDSFKSFGSDDDYVIGVTEGDKNINKSVSRTKTIKQVLKQQQREIERHVSKDKQMSVANEGEEYASTFNKDEMKMTKGSKIQRSKFNTYRERSYQNTLGKSALKTANSVDNLRVNTQVGMNKGNDNKHMGQYEHQPEIRKISHETLSSGSSQSMHTAEEGSMESPTTPEANKATLMTHEVGNEMKLEKSSPESVVSHGSDMKVSVKDESLSPKADEGKRSKNKLYSILKKGKLKFNLVNGTKKDSEPKTGKIMSVDTTLDHSVNESLKSSPSSPVKLPSFSSKRTLSGTGSGGNRPVFDDTTHVDVFDDEKVMIPEGYNLKTIDDDVMSPISPSEMNMFLEDFDMSDNDADDAQVILESDHEDEQEQLFREINPMVSTVKVKLFDEETSGLEQRQLFKYDQRETMQVSPVVTQPIVEDDEYEDVLPPRKLTFDDVHRPKIPNSPMKYRDSSFGFPLPPLTISTVIMFDHRLVVSMERAIYRLSHMKLSESKRELRQQVLLSNFMYSYLNLVNHSLYLQKLEEDAVV
ncbi:hypothetical protein ACO0R3_003876 [Hanseniaspora guilliermondii]